MPRITSLRKATHCCLEAPPLACDAIVKYQGIGKASLHRPQTGRPEGARCVVGCNEQTEMQFGDRDDADRSVGSRWRGLGTDQHRGIKNDAQLRDPRVSQVCVKPLEILA